MGSSGEAAWAGPNTKTQPANRQYNRENMPLTMPANRSTDNPADLFFVPQPLASSQVDIIEVVHVIKRSDADAAFAKGLVAYLHVRLG